VRVEEQSLVGREQQLAAVAGLIGDAGIGRGRVAVMLGDAGIGKTRLSEAAETMARHAGFDVAWGRCSSADMPSYWPWRQALTRLLGETDLLDLGRFASQPELFAAVAEAIEARTRAHAILVIFEDAHWADPGSLALLEFLAGVVAGQRLMLLITARDEAVLLPTSAGVRRLPLTGSRRLDGCSPWLITTHCYLVRSLRDPDCLPIAASMRTKPRMALVSGQLAVVLAHKATNARIDPPLPGLLSVTVAPVKAYEPGMTDHPARHETGHATFERRHHLGTAWSDRLHQMSADPELADERFGNLRECRRDEDGVERRCCRHAFGAVALDDIHILNALGCEVAPSLVGQVRPSFNTRHKRRQPGKQRGLVAIAGTHLKDVLITSEPERLDHPG
jgi:AAA ATPase domain